MIPPQVSVTVKFEVEFASLLELISMFTVLKVLKVVVLGNIRQHV